MDPLPGRPRCRDGAQRSGGRRARYADDRGGKPIPRLISTTVLPVLLAKNGGCRLRLSRLEITATARNSAVSHNEGLVRLGDGESTLEAQPSEITLDRVWIHGTPTTSTKNGAVFNGRSLALIDSWIDQVRWKGIESHCVVAWTGAGPMKLVNDHFDCASIGVLIGGAARAIPGVAPSDIGTASSPRTRT